jgi:hypothetical protein
MRASVTKRTRRLARQIGLLVPPLLGLAAAIGYLIGWEEGARLRIWSWLGFFCVWGAVSLAIVPANWRHRPGFGNRAKLRFWGATGLGLLAVFLFVSQRIFPATSVLVPAIAGAAVSAVLARWFIQCVNTSRSFLWEAARWLLIAGTAAFVIHPYATRSLVGGGDAQHYAQQLQDTIVQAKAGVFPILVGQSSYAFNGDFHPLRTAPYFQYAGLAVNFLTAGHLGATGVMNLLIVASLLVAGLITYRLGLQVGGRRLAWHACLLTIAGISGPGLLSLIYSGDMVASWMTLPFFPALIFGIIRIRDEGPNPRALLLVSAALAAMWLAHAPLAFWTSLLVILGLGECWLCSHEKIRSLWMIAGAGAIGLCLSAYVFISVAALEIPNDPNLLAHMRGGGVLGSLRDGWKGIFMPVDQGAVNLLQNLQLSPVLWLALAAGFVGACTQGRIPVAIWAYVFGLLWLLTPNAITAKLWSLMPSAVLGATDKWPMQRFYPILTMIVPIAALAGFRTRRFAGPIARWGLLALLLVGTSYSLVESRKFVRRGLAITLSKALTEQRLRPENTGLSRYSYEYFGRLPSYFRTGPISPFFQNRLLRPNTLTIADSNQHHLFNASLDHIHASTLHQLEKTDYGARFTPKLSIEPGRIYAVSFDLGQSVTEGVLELTSPTSFQQHTISPTLESRAFSDGGGLPSSFALWTSGQIRDEVELRLYLAPGRAPPSASSTTLRLIEVDPRTAPFRLESLIPYRIAVANRGPGWVETPKIFIPGYSALVDERETKVARSPDGLVMVPIDSGTREIVLKYKGTPLLHGAFWLTAVSWMMVGGLVLLPRRTWANWRSRQCALLIQLGTIAVTATAMWVLATGAAAALHRSTSLAELTKEPRLALRVTLPVGRKNFTENIATKQMGGAEVCLFAHYASGQKVQFGFLRNGRPWLTSSPMPANYIVPHDLKVAWEPLNEAAGAGKTRFRIEVDHRVLIDRLAALDAPSDAQSAQLSLNQVQKFTGKIHSSSTAPDSPPTALSEEYAP